MEPAIRTLCAYLRQQAASAPTKALLGQPGLWLDSACLYHRVTALAAFFREKGLPTGSLVCLRTERSLGCALTILALQAAGAVAVLVDARTEPHSFLNSCEPPVPVHCFLEMAGDHLQTPWGEVDLCSLPEASAPLPETDPQAPGFIIFTSGTTGKPKAVMLSQAGLVNNLLDSQPLGYYAADDLALGAIPLHHVFGLVLLAGVCVLGYGMYFPESTEIPCLLRSIQQQRITRMNGVPSLYLALAKQAAGYDVSSLRAGFIGGSPWTAEQFCYIEEALGMTLVPAYGMSECVGISCASYRAPQAQRANGVGPFYARNDGRILLDDGSEAAVGQVGEISFRSPARMAGYYPNVLPEDAYFATGDLGFLDEGGILHITGRKKDIIIRNGNNLSPRKIEEALLSIDGVADAAVVGMPDDKAGEVPWAMVVCSPLLSATLPRQLTGRLAKNELPLRYIPVDALPRNAAGKVDKQKIREVLQAWM